MTMAALDPIVLALAELPAPWGMTATGVQCVLCWHAAPVVAGVGGSRPVTLVDGKRGVALQVFSLDPSAHAETCPWRRAVEARAAQWKCPGHDLLPAGYAPMYPQAAMGTGLGGYVVHSDRGACELYQAGAAERKPPSPRCSSYAPDTGHRCDEARGDHASHRHNGIGGAPIEGWEDPLICAVCGGQMHRGLDGMRVCMGTCPDPTVRWGGAPAKSCREVPHVFDGKGPTCTACGAPEAMFLHVAGVRR